MLVQLLDTLTTREAQDGVDVQSLVGQNLCGSLYLTGFQLSSQHHEDVAVLALMAHPVFVLIVADGRETDVHAQFGGLEQQFLHGQSRLHLIHADEDTQ